MNPSTTRGGLDGKGGTSEYGLTGAWERHRETTPRWPPAPSSSATARIGGSIGDLATGVNRYGGARSVSPSALAENGLLNDGATLWFSVDLGYGTGWQPDQHHLGDGPREQLV